MALWVWHHQAINMENYLTDPENDHSTSLAMLELLLSSDVTVGHALSFYKSCSQDVY